MAEKVDMSLDDIIALTKKNRRGGGGGRGRGGGQTRRGRGGSPRGGGGGLRGRGGVQKRRSGSFGRTRNLKDDAVWEHDLYEGGRGKPQISRSSGYQQNQEARLMVSNLDFAVNDSDIYELFAECGPLKRGSINYDRSGRSLGTAEVVFERRSDAVKAMKQYNNVPLDGLPMNIELIGGAEEKNGAASRGFSARRLAPRRYDDRESRPQRSQQSARGGGGRGRGRGRGRGGRQEKKVPTAEELDAQLDAYATVMDVE